ncbi:MAG: four helix bundle protein [Epulopiscium sp.]|nr:four helix bundle protein [Candidatus Epulonipiscium sp.]
MSRENIPEQVYVKDFKQLAVWQKATTLADRIYEIVKGFPDFELYQMQSQILRATTSISANLAEGNGQTFPKKEYTFFNTALGSANEVRNWLEQAYRRGYIQKSEFDELDGLTIEIIKMIIGRMKNLKKMNEEE